MHSSPYSNHLSLKTLAMRFNKRTYSNPKEFFTDLFFPVKNRKLLKEIRSARD